MDNQNGHSIRPLMPDIKKRIKWTSKMDIKNGHPKKDKMDIKNGH